MSPHQTIAVAVRLFAVWLAAYALQTASATFLDARVATKGLVVAGIIGILTLLVALLLWFFPLTTAKKLLPGPAANFAPGETPDTWLAMGCALIGLWLLASAIPHVVRDALYLYSSNSSYDDSVEFKHWLAYRFVEIVVAVWLIVGTRGFVKVFWWARSAGTKKVL
jgi:hypothetical protein